MYDNGYVRLTALPTEILLFPQRFASALPPFEGITSPLRSAFPPLKGGRGDVPLRSVFCHSERSDESPPFPREIPHYVRNDKGGSKSIFIQAYSPQKKQNRGINTPPLRNGAEIKRAFSPWLEYG